MTAPTPPTFNLAAIKYANDRKVLAAMQSCYPQAMSEDALKAATGIHMNSVRAALGRLVEAAIVGAAPGPDGWWLLLVRHREHEQPRVGGAENGPHPVSPAGAGETTLSHLPTGEGNENLQPPASSLQSGEGGQP